MGCLKTCSFQASLIFTRSLHWPAQSLPRFYVVTATIGSSRSYDPVLIGVGLMDLLYLAVVLGLIVLTLLLIFGCGSLEGH